MLPHTAVYIGAFTVRSLAPCDKDQIIPRLYVRIQFSECFPDDPSRAITLDSLADLLSGGYSDTKVIDIIFINVSYKVGRNIAFAPCIRTAVIPVLL